VDADAWDRCDKMTYIKTALTHKPFSKALLEITRISRSKFLVEPALDAMLDVSGLKRTKDPDELGEQACGTHPHAPSGARSLTHSLVCSQWRRP
jgi:hypothetical protein